MLKRRKAPNGENQESETDLAFEVDVMVEEIDAESILLIEGGNPAAAA